MFHIKAISSCVSRQAELMRSESVRSRGKISLRGPAFATAQGWRFRAGERALGVLRSRNSSACALPELQWWTRTPSALVSPQRTAR